MEQHRVIIEHADAVTDGLQKAQNGEFQSVNDRRAAQTTADTTATSTGHFAELHSRI